MGKVIAICNRKGGVGKTITALSMAAGLAKQRKNVLLIDCDDSNPALTKTVGMSDREDTISDLLLFSYCGKLKKSMLPEVIVRTTEDFDFIPADETLAAVTVSISNAPSEDAKYNALKKIVDAVKESYDYIILDSAPALNILTLNILSAADEVLIVSQAQQMSREAIDELQSAITESKKRRNENLRLAGMLITMVDNRISSSKGTAATMKDAYESQGIKTFNTTIPRGAAGETFATSGASILQYRPFSKVAKAYRDFVAEYLEKEA